MHLFITIVLALGGCATTDAFDQGEAADQKGKGGCKGRDACDDGASGDSASDVVSATMRASTYGGGADSGSLYLDMPTTELNGESVSTEAYLSFSDAAEGESDVWIGNGSIRICGEGLSCSGDASNAILDCPDAAIVYLTEDNGSAYVGFSKTVTYVGASGVDQDGVPFYLATTSATFTADEVPRTDLTLEISR